MRFGQDAAPADTNPAVSAKWKPIKEFHWNRRQIMPIYTHTHTVFFVSPHCEMKPGSRKMKPEEQDLFLFGQILKRDEERGISLLQPESVELEPAQGILYICYILPENRRAYFFFK